MEEGHVPLSKERTGRRYAGKENGAFLNIAQGNQKNGEFTSAKHKKGHKHVERAGLNGEKVRGQPSA